ncbi:MAG: site-specific integrase [Clostridia bacterium]|nr:site-specific integrase [Clostridia bacterium]
MNKRANGEGTIRKREDGSWEARFVYNNTRYSLYGRTQAIVRKKLTDAQAKIDGGAYTPPSSITVAEWLTKWQKEYLRNIKTSTRERYDVDIRLHIIPEIGKVTLSKLSSDRITTLYNRMQDTGLSVKSIKNLHGTLHAALERALILHLVSKNPCEEVILPESEEAKEEMHPLKDAQVKQFRLEIKGNRYELLYNVALFTGMRQGELIGLTWDCIDFDRNTIHVYRQLKRIAKGNGEFKFTTLKNKQDRTFKVPLEVINLLKKVKRQQVEWKLKCGESWQETGLVFTQEDGSNVNDRTVYNNFKRIVKKMGLPDVRFHDLRHTYATLALQNGIDPKTVSSTLGHATVAFTLDKYGHVSETMWNDSAEKMQRFIESM